MTIKEFFAVSDVGTIRDSMQLDSGEDIVTMIVELTHGLKADIRVFVSGHVKVTFKDQCYKGAHCMPKELLDCYAKRLDPEKVFASEADKYECLYYVSENNWLELGIEVTDKDGKLVYDNYDVIDVPDDNSPEGWKAYLEEICEKDLKLRYWTVNISVPKMGYSFVVCSLKEYTDDEVLEQSRLQELFQEGTDADIAVVEEITDNDYEMRHWEKEVVVLY